MPVQNLGTNRYAALQATKKFSEGTIGFGVHRAIESLYFGNQHLGGYGGFGNKYSAKIGEFFQRSDIQELMSQPLSNKEASLSVAKKEVEYWHSVFNDPKSTADDIEGARIALRFTPEVRAQLHEYYASGQYTKANLLVIKYYPPALLPFCFAVGTPILMSDGTFKPIEQVKIDHTLAI